MRKSDFYDRIKISIIFGAKIAENVWFFLYKLQYNEKIHDFFEFSRDFEHASLSTFTHRQKPRPRRMESWESQLSIP